MKTQIVGVITSTDDMKQALKDNEAIDVFEWRVDCCAANTIMNGLRRIGKPVIITARDSKEGGKRPEWKLEDQEAYYLELIPLATFIDIEVDNAPIMTRTIALAKKERAQIILSYHNFETTPSLQFLADKYGKAMSLGAHFFKVAVKAQKPQDLERLIKFASSDDMKWTQIVPMAMGRCGKISRLIFAHAEVPFVYCSIGEAVVPGQWRASDLKKTLSRIQ